MQQPTDFDNGFEFKPAYTYTTKTGTWRIPPGLRRALPFYLHKPWSRIGKPIRLFEYMAKHLGKIAHYRLFGIHIVFLNDPEYVREMLVNQNSSFVRERTIRRLNILLIPRTSARAALPRPRSTGSASTPTPVRWCGLRRKRQSAGKAAAPST